MICLIHHRYLCEMLTSIPVLRPHYFYLPIPDKTGLSHPRHSIELFCLKSDFTTSIASEISCCEYSVDDTSVVQTLSLSLEQAHKLISIIPAIAMMYFALFLCFILNYSYPFTIFLYKHTYLLFQHFPSY